MAVAQGGMEGRAAARLTTGTTLLIGLVGAALYAFANWTTFAITIPGTDEVSLRPQFALVIFVGFAFGPLAGVLTGLVGNVVGDWLSAYGAFRAWPWSVANGLVGLLSGLFGIALATRLEGGASRTIMAGVAGVVATLLGFLVIFVEVWTQSLTLETIFATEYLPTVVVNSVVAAVITPIVVHYWSPLHDIFGRR